MALVHGAREIGPAIMRDVALFVTVATTETATGAASFPDPVEAYLAAVRLFVVPQYEGASVTETGEVLSILKAVFDDPPETAWRSLETTLGEVALA